MKKVEFLISPKSGAEFDSNVPWLGQSFSISGSSKKAQKIHLIFGQ